MVEDFSERELVEALLRARFPGVSRVHKPGGGRSYSGLDAVTYGPYTAYEQELKALQLEALREQYLGVVEKAPAAAKPKREGTQAYNARMAQAARNQVAGIEAQPFLLPARWAELWRAIPECTVWEAVCLSFNIEPDDTRYKIRDWLERCGTAFGGRPSGFPEDFPARMRVTVANIGSKKSIRGAGDNPRERISLIEFASFAHRTWGNGVPDELRALRPQQELQEEREEVSLIGELCAHGGVEIDWPKWMRKPVWLAADAARLMGGLDPDLYADLSHDVGSFVSTQERATALRMEKLATALGMLHGSPQQWLDWAELHFAGEVAVRFISAALRAPSVEPAASMPTPAPTKEKERSAALDSVWTTTQPAWTNPLHVSNTIVSKRVLVDLFATDDGGGAAFTRKQWESRLKDPPEWLKPAIAVRGRKPEPHTWWLLEIAERLVSRGDADARTILASLEAAKASPEIAQCLPAVTEWARGRAQLKRLEEDFG